MDPIFEAFGIENWPAPDSLKKLLNDHLVCARAQELMVKFFAEQVVDGMHPIERAALLKRISPPPVDNVVRWNVSQALRSGRANITARFRSEEIFFDGTPENAPLIEFHGEHPPAAVLAAYSKLYDPTNAAQMDPAYWHARTSKPPRPGPVLE